MNIALPAFLSLALAIPAAAQSFDPAQMDDETRSAFGEAVRSYLLENPEVLMEAISVLEEREAALVAQNAEQMISDHSEQLFEAGDWIGGNPEGDVTVVEFLDYNCGYCRSAHPEVAELLQTDGDIRYIVKEFPVLGEMSVMASRFALATREVAGDEAYEAVHDAMMTLDGRIDDPAAFRIIAEDQDLDWPAIEMAMDSPAVQETIDETLALGRSLGINATPTFVFGDQMVPGYRPLDAMQDIVAEERG